MLTDMRGLAYVGGTEVFAIPGIVPGAQPSTGLGQLGPVLDMPAMDRRETCRTEQATVLMADDGANTDWSVRRSKRRRANFRYIQPPQVCKTSKRINIGCFALIRRHARCGVTLQVLDGHKALAVR